MQDIVNLFLFVPRLLWNIIVLALAIWLEVIWIGFIFGSVVGVLLLLAFWLEGFFLPWIFITSMFTKVWPE